MTSTRRPAAVLALAQGRTTGQAAKAAGVSGRTVLRWLDEPEFHREVADMRTELLQLAVGRLAAGATKAVDALVDALDTERGQARVQAARTLLDACLSLRESLDLEQRLAALEQDEEARRR
ncbi:hypothetical protein [Streptomyces sp. NPDC018045]|uniref:hypothetical protein n=1 Tax=unclassified Streptomyces TaxID=2593676 RepID=UPI00378E0376